MESSTVKFRTELQDKKSLDCIENTRDTMSNKKRAEDYEEDDDEEEEEVVFEEEDSEGKLFICCTSRMSQHLNLRFGCLFRR